MVLQQSWNRRAKWRRVAVVAREFMSVRAFGWCSNVAIALLWAIPLTLVVIAVHGSGWLLAQSRVVGEYSAEHDNGLEQLELHADGTYVQRYQRRGGALQLETNGKWEFKRRLFARPLVVLHDFTPHFPRHDGQTKRWELEVEEDFGMIRLYVDPKPPRDIYVGSPDPSYYK